MKDLVVVITRIDGRTYMESWASEPDETLDRAIRIDGEQDISLIL